MLQQTYAIGIGSVFALNLDPNGTSFWTGTLGGANVRKVNLATGAIEESWSTGLTDLYGLAVYGESRQVAAASTPVVATAARFQNPAPLACSPCAGRTGCHASSQSLISTSVTFKPKGRPCLGRTGPFRCGRTRSQTLAIALLWPCLPRHGHQTAVGGADASAWPVARRDEAQPARGNDVCPVKIALGACGICQISLRRPAQDHKPMIDKELLSWHEICFMPTADQPKRNPQSMNTLQNATAIFALSAGLALPAHAYTELTLDFTEPTGTVQSSDTIEIWATLSVVGDEPFSFDTNSTDEPIFGLPATLLPEFGNNYSEGAVRRSLRFPTPRPPCSSAAVAPEASPVAAATANTRSRPPPAPTPGSRWAAPTRLRRVIKKLPAAHPHANHGQRRQEHTSSTMWPSA